MNRLGLKKALAGLVMAASLFLTFGIISTPEAQAQRRDREWLEAMQRARAREIARDRARERARERARQRAYRYGTRRNYPYYDNYGYGSYGRYGGYNSAEEQRGYRNGLKEGRDDAQDRDSFNPSRHSSFRDGNPAYRSGFHRGYEQGYREYGYYRRW
jgi:hypothetical protein